MEYLASFGNNLVVYFKNEAHTQAGNSVCLNKLSFKEKCMALAKINKKSTNIQVVAAFIVCLGVILFNGNIL